MCVGGNIFHGAMGMDSLFLMRPVKGWYVCLVHEILEKIPYLAQIKMMMLDKEMPFFLSFWNRSNHKTPIRNLYLCGSGSHPGGGVMGAPGRNAARVVLQEFKTRYQ